MDLKRIHKTKHCTWNTPRNVVFYEFPFTTRVKIQQKLELFGLFELQFKLYTVLEITSHKLTERHTMASALRGVYQRKSVISPWTNLFHIYVHTYVLSMTRSTRPSDFMLKNMGRPGYAAIDAAHFVLSALHH